MNLKSVLLILCFGTFSMMAFASTPTAVNVEDHQEGLVSYVDSDAYKALSKKELRAVKKAQKNQQKLERKVKRFQKFASSKKGQKLLGGLDDPVDKWFWFWVIGWGAAIVLGALIGGVLISGGLGSATILATLVWLVGLAGTVSLVIWLVKKFA
ncbi:MAG: hypothetical protein HKN16_05085 [Saprospiraceae bacterium]|nr:hypothetical protein [Saprospiraceae bacterium]